MDPDLPIAGAGLRSIFLSANAALFDPLPAILEVDVPAPQSAGLAWAATRPKLMKDERVIMPAVLEKALQDLGDKLPYEERTRIEQQVNQLREAMKGDDVSRMQQLSETLEQMVHSLGQQTYATEREGPGGPGGPPDDTVEGEVREV